MRSLVSPQAVIITNDGAGNTLLVHSAWFLSMFEVPVPDDRNILHHALIVSQRFFYFNMRQCLQEVTNTSLENVL